MLTGEKREEKKKIRSPGAAITGCVRNKFKKKKILPRPNNIKLARSKLTLVFNEKCVITMAISVGHVSYRTSEI